ncbi:hypothetical protein MBLNU230_g1530t1 [Neophaeotheca triangularis]
MATRRSTRATKHVVTYAEQFGGDGDVDVPMEAPGATKKKETAAKVAPKKAPTKAKQVAAATLPSTDSEIVMEDAPDSSAPSSSAPDSSDENGELSELGLSSDGLGSTPVNKKKAAGKKAASKKVTSKQPGGSASTMKEAALELSKTVTLSTGETRVPPHGVLYLHYLKNMPKKDSVAKPVKLGPPPGPREPQWIARVKPGKSETRAARYIDQPPQEYYAFLERATTQKMFILERTRKTHENCHAGHDDCPREDIELAGSRGNVYTVVISHFCTCNCPAMVYGTNNSGTEQCKHIIYVLHHVLKAKDDLKYQAAFLTSELRDIFANAPKILSEAVEEVEDNDGNRKTVEEGDECPICCVEFKEEEKVVWCKAACGNNVHAKCFDMWAKQKSPVKCPFCRTDWVGVEDVGNGERAFVTKVKKPIAGVTSRYLNVRDQLAYD